MKKLTRESRDMLEFVGDIISFFLEGAAFQITWRIFAVDMAHLPALTYWESVISIWLFMRCLRTWPPTARRAAQAFLDRLDAMPGYPPDQAGGKRTP